MTLSLPVSIKRLGSIVTSKKSVHANTPKRRQDKTPCNRRESIDTCKGHAYRSLFLAEKENMQRRWAKATKNCRVADLGSEKLKQLVYSGMPMKYRTELWMEWAMKKRTNSSCMNKLQNVASDRAIHDIVKDLPRTQPMFEGEELLCLQNVLQAYAGWNPSIGYCQGMNFIASIFVGLGFSEVESLNCLNFVVEEICPGFHNAELSGFHRDAAVLDKLVQHFLPSVHEDLAEVGLPISMLAMDHFMALGSRNWSLVSVVRMWDVIFMEGSRALFASFLALLELYFPIGRRKSSLANAGAGGISSIPDVMDAFKRDSADGVSKHIDTVMSRVRRYVHLIPEPWIEEIRESVSSIQ